MSDPTNWGAVKLTAKVAWENVMEALDFIKPHDAALVQPLLEAAKLDLQVVIDLLEGT